MTKDENAVSTEGGFPLLLAVLFGVKNPENFSLGIPSYRYHGYRECVSCGTGPTVTAVYRQNAEVDLSPQPPHCRVCAGTGYVTFKASS